MRRRTLVASRGLSPRLARDARYGAPIAEEPEPPRQGAAPPDSHARVVCVEFDPVPMNARRFLRVRTDLAEEVRDRIFSSTLGAEAEPIGAAQEAEPGELILIKASGGDHLERIALSHFDDIVCWRERCGKARPCPNCVYYRTPSAPPVSEWHVGQGESAAQDRHELNEEVA